MRDDIKIPLFEQLIFVIVFLLIFSFVAHKVRATSSPAFTDQNVIDAIVGESASDEFTVKMCVAEAIRNRKTLRGVYGFHAAHNNKESASTWADAAQAWIFVKTHPDYNFVYGATEFRNKYEKQPDDDDFDYVKQCGEFLFYKPTTKGENK